MHKPPSDSDSESDKHDTAFGGLAPRGGPVTKQPLAKPPVKAEGQDHSVRWIAIVAVIVVMVLAWLYYGGRR